MVIDYSQTINRYTLLDAYPSPNIEEMVNKVAQYEVFSTVYMRSVYHQMPIKSSDKQHTAFEARGKLYQFTRMPFCLTNAVACFQHKMDDFVEHYKLHDTFLYLDNITIAGKIQEEHDKNLAAFFSAAKDYGLTLRDENCHYSLKSIDLLSYRISHGEISPDPERLCPL